MPSNYASGTSVSADRSRAEIEKILRQYGATAFAYAWDLDQTHQMVAFQISGRQVRMTLPLPKPDDPLFTQTPTHRARTTLQAQQAYEQEVRRRWRALFAVIKAKLVAVHDGISTIEREFLSDIITTDGRTVSEVVSPFLASGAPLAITMER